MFGSCTFLLAAAVALGQATEPPVTVSEHLEPLAWMIGDWEARPAGPEGPQVVMKQSAKWILDGQFMVEEIAIELDGLPVITGRAIRGWDAKAGRITYWFFRSDGSHGKGVYEQKDDRTWAIELAGVTADGRPITTLLEMTVTGEDTYTWHAKNVLDGDRFTKSIRYKLKRS